MISLFKVRMEPEAVVKASEVLKSGYIGQGPVVEEFENRLKEYFNYPYVVTTNNATSAEHLALHMLRRDYEGSDVLCTPLTCTATNWPVLLNDYDIKWVDVNNCNMDMDDLQRKLSPCTRIIYIVHWGGYPVDYKALEGVVDKCLDLYKFEPVIIEDCAHAMGSTYHGKKVGTVLRSYATYSFQAIKHVTSIDGGCLLCPDEESYKRAKLLRWYGIDRETNSKDFRCENDIEEIGFKFHMNDVSAAVGVENLKNVEYSIDGHKRCAEFYNKAFKDNPNVRLIRYNNECSYWIYTMFVDRVNDFIKKMKKCDIMVSRVHERNDIHSCVKTYKTALPSLDAEIKEMICIPCGWWVSNGDLKYIADMINEGW